MKVAIGFGSNLGDRINIVKTAIRDVRIIGPVVSVSSLYRSAPVGGPEQDDYLNGVVVVDTDLDPETVLTIVLGIEERHGRVRTERWGARTLDLDLLFFDGVDLESPTLTVPHPRMLKRRFVLEPLAEIWPEAEIQGWTAHEVLAATMDQDVTLVSKSGWERASGRGGRWVAVQALLLVLLVLLAIFDTDALGTSSVLPWLGRALSVLAAIEMWLGSRALGDNLTAYPEPLGEGQLVDRGILGWVRHPLYGANVLIFFGVALHQRSALALALALAAAAFFWKKSEHEESRLLQKYSQYHAYMERVRRRFVPWLL